MDDRTGKDDGSDDGGRERLSGRKSSGEFLLVDMKKKKEKKIDHKMRG